MPSCLISWNFPLSYIVVRRGPGKCIQVQRRPVHRLEMTLHNCILCITHPSIWLHIHWYHASIYSNICFVFLKLRNHHIYFSTSSANQSQIWSSGCGTIFSFIIEWSERWGPIHEFKDRHWHLFSLTRIQISLSSRSKKMVVCYVICCIFNLT